MNTKVEGRLWKFQAKSKKYQPHYDTPLSGKEKATPVTDAAPQKRSKELSDLNFNQIEQNHSKCQKLLKIGKNCRNNLTRQRDPCH